MSAIVPAALARLAPRNPTSSIWATFASSGRSDAADGLGLGLGDGGDGGAVGSGVGARLGEPGVPVGTWVGPEVAGGLATARAHAVTTSAAAARAMPARTRRRLISSTPALYRR
jgi:hypothetical protein